MGIIWDGSKYQANEVDFSKLAGEIDLAILRDQYGYTTPDTSYNTFVAECKKYGIPFNTYAFFAAVSPSDAVAEAKADASRMDKASVIAWIDVETMSIKSGKDSDLQTAVNAYYDTLKADGWSKVGIYSGEYFYNSHGLANCKKDCLWLAAYGSNDGTMQTAYRPQVPGVDLWQYTSVGKLGAVNGNADLSILVGSKPLSFFTGGGNSSSFVVGDTVAVASWATNYQTGQTIPSWVKGVPHKVIQTKGAALLLADIMSWVYAKDVTLIEKIAPPAPAAPAAPQEPAPAAPTPPAEVKVPAASEPAPAPATSAPVEVPKPVEPPATPPPAPVEAAPAQVYITVPDLEGGKLGYVHDYIMNRGWWINITKNDDDTLNLEVGIFIKDSKPYNDFINFLKDGSYNYTESDHE